jgi:hypothetical protein
MKRLTAALTAVAAVLVAAVPGTAAPPPGSRLTASVRPVIYGSQSKVSGRLTVSGVGRPGVRVRLFAQRFPYHAASHQIASRLTTATGGYAFRVRLSRDTRVRVLAANGTRSSLKLAVVLPRQDRLRTRESSNGRRLALQLVVHGPSDVRLTGGVVVYLGRYHAHTLNRAGVPPMRPLRNGLSRMRSSFGLPASWHGGYRVEICYSAPRSTGMYEPGVRCPRVYKP